MLKDPDAQRIDYDHVFASQFGRAGLLVPRFIRTVESAIEAVLSLPERIQAFVLDYSRANNSAFLVANTSSLDSFITQFGKLLHGREDVRLTDRLTTDGLWRRGRRRRWGGPLPWDAIDRQNGQASNVHQTVLAGKRERRSGGLPLRESADLVIKRVVNRYAALTSIARRRAARNRRSERCSERRC